MKSLFLEEAKPSTGETQEKAKCEGDIHILAMLRKIHIGFVLRSSIESKDLSHENQP